MKFRIRLDEIEGAYPLLKTLCKDANQYVLVHHQINDNPHYHLYLDKPMYMSCQTVRYHLKKLTENSTNYSVKQCDEDRVQEYVQYLFNTKHDNKPTLVDHRYPDDLIQKAKDDAQRIAEEFKQKVKKGKKNITLYEMAMEVDEITDVDDNLIRNAIHVLHKYMKVHDDFLITKIVTTIQSKRDINFVIERVRRRISNM